jgi:hypothetical protein
MIFNFNPCFWNVSGINILGRQQRIGFSTLKLGNFSPILIFVLSQFITNICLSQDFSRTSADSLSIKGQLSLWANYNINNSLPIITGGRYIPSAYYGIGSGSNKHLDFEASANVFGSFAFHPFDTSYSDGGLKPYRLWMRYSSDQFEIRLGLQKINFGSASMLRPLMWFDQMDPRDPLQLTDGVWALLVRYYFLNNANIWLWGLYGNHDPRAWEIIPSNKKIPEFGGRIQIPVASGEAAISYHHRTADNRGMVIFNNYFEKIPEDRFGFDARWDFVTGLWIEGSWTRKRLNLGTLTNQEIINAGIDYTFGLGNGLYVAYEHLLMSYDQKAFEFANRTSFSLLTVSYPVGFFDKASAIIYYNWTNKTIYNFITWQKQLDNIMLYVMGYWNPDFYQLPAQTASQNYYAGKGVQIMFVFNH